MVSCAQRSCSSRKGVDKKESTGITFHRFPKDPERRIKWSEFVTRGSWVPTKYSVLCSKHFCEMYIDRTSKSCVWLRDNAVPTINIYRDQIEQPLLPKNIFIEREVSLPSTSNEIESEICTDSQTTHCSKSAMTSFNENEVMTPRKSKLNTKLRNALRVSTERKRKLIITRRKLFRRDQRITNIKNIIGDLRKKKFMEEEHLDILSKLGGPNELYLRQIGKTKNKALPRTYSNELKVFALTLHYYSPAAYQYVRRVFKTCLPHVRTISRWYQSIDGKPGFTQESFEALRLKAGGDKKIICGLIIDEMSIRQHEEWVSSQNKCYGYVDMGTGSKEDTLASNALVFLLNCINEHWKIPVGYFLLAGMSGEKKKSLIMQCLDKCNDVGIKIISLTSDGPPVNLTMAKLLGCELNHLNLKPSFKHPSTGETIVFFLDPSHMIKLIRNTLGEKGSFVNNKGEVISWNYFKELHNLQQNESFHLANKIRSEHISFWKQKMKVRLATQVFSESVAKALQFCEEINLKQFVGVSATATFVLLINNLFDILNSRNLCQHDNKKPVSKKNYNKIKTFLDEVDNYISGLRTHVGGILLLDHERHTGFLGLKICISSLKILYEELIANDTLKFLPLHKISQDHIELYFGNIRGHGGHNNNPTARQFESAYKKTICHVELQNSFRGNCIRLEQLKILNSNPIKHINISSKGYRNDDEENIQDVIFDHDYLPDVLSEFSKYVIAYIAGNVVHV